MIDFDKLYKKYCLFPQSLISYQSHYELSKTGKFELWLDKRDIQRKLDWFLGKRSVDDYYHWTSNN